MKFTCRKENLAKSLAIVSKAVPIKHTFPILTNVLIVSKEGRLSLSGTNLDTAISTYVGGSIESEGSITVPAKQLLEYISHLSTDSVTLTLNKDILSLEAGTTKSKFNGIPASDFPDLPEVDDSLPFIEINPKDFSNAVHQVGFSIATDDSRPVLSGILFSYDKENSKLYFVASDGYRLSEKILTLEANIDSFSVILPAKTLLEIARIFASSEENIKIYFNQSQNLCLFQCEDTLISSRIIEGNFPDYKRIIPKETNIEATFESALLHEAVKLTNVFTKNSSNALKILLDPSGLITVSSSTQETGENNTNVEALIVSESVFEVVFNSKYLLDFLSNNKAEKLVFKAVSATSPCLIFPFDSENFLHVMAPMQLND